MDSEEMAPNSHKVVVDVFMSQNQKIAARLKKHGSESVSESVT